MSYKSKKFRAFAHSANLWVMVHHRVVKIESLEVVKAGAPDIAGHWRFELGTKLGKF